MPRRVVYLADAPYIHTQRWVRHFVQRGWDAHVISFRPATIDGATVHHIGGFEAIGKARYVLHAPRMRSLVRALHPDIVHALHLTSYGFLAAVAGVRPSIVSVWGTDILEAPSFSPAHRWITRYALSHATAITATGDLLAEATRPFAPPGKSVHVIPYGVDLDLFRPAERPLRTTVMVGTVARLSPEKGFHHLLRAVSHLRAKGLPLDVLLAGDGPSRPSLEGLARELDLSEQVRFIGEVPHEDVPRVLQQLDVFVMPSTAEGFGVSALEASAMELPVIASDVHGIPDVVCDGATGLLVPPADPPALAAAIERLATDAPLRTKLGVAGRAFVTRRYRWQDNAAQMEALYDNLTSAP